MGCCRGLKGGEIMIINKTSGVTILRPSSNKFKLRKNDSDEEVFYDIVYLSNNSNPDAYEEISIYEIEGYEPEMIEVKTDIDNLTQIINEQESLIIELTTQLAILNLTNQGGDTL